MHWIKSLLIPIALFSGVASANTSIVVLALFKDKVVLRIDGERTVLKAGQTSKAGVTLIKANSHGATMIVDGQTQDFNLGSQIQSSYSGPKHALARIPMDAQGMYRTKGTINNHAVSFLVDTGASMIAMNGYLAERLNIAYQHLEPIPVETASGQAKAFHIKLEKVQVGDITLRQVEALVVDGESPREVLLGMSFLKQVKMEDKSSVLQLQKTVR